MDRFSQENYILNDIWSKKRIMVKLDHKMSNFCIEKGTSHIFSMMKWSILIFVVTWHFRFEIFYCWIDVDVEFVFNFGIQLWCINNCVLCYKNFFFSVWKCAIYIFFFPVWHSFSVSLSCLAFCLLISSDTD